MKFIKYILLSVFVVAIASCSNKTDSENQKTGNTVVEAAGAVEKDAAAVKSDNQKAKSQGKVLSASKESESLVIITNDSDFDAKVLKADKLALVDFYADWCGPCRMLAPTIKKIASEYSGKAIVAKLNVDKLKELSGKYKISSIPCVILFKDGNEVGRIVGLRTIDTYKEALDKIIKK